MCSFDMFKVSSLKAQENRTDFTSCDVYCSNFPKEYFLIDEEAMIFSHRRLSLNVL